MNDLQQRIFSQTKVRQLMQIATVAEDGKPHVRPVVGCADASLTLRFSTYLDSQKIQHIRHNPNVHITMGAADASATSWLQIEGTASISTSEAERRAFWFDELRAFVSGVDDPRYAVVIIQPSKIERRALERSASAMTMVSEVWQPAA